MHEGLRGFANIILKIDRELHKVPKSQPLIKKTSNPIFMISKMQTVTKSKQRYLWLGHIIVFHGVSEFTRLTEITPQRGNLVIHSNREISTQRQPQEIMPILHNLDNGFTSLIWISLHIVCPLMNVAGESNIAINNSTLIWLAESPFQLRGSGD